MGRLSDWAAACVGWVPRCADWVLVLVSWWVRLGLGFVSAAVSGPALCAGSTGRGVIAVLRLRCVGGSLGVLGLAVRFFGLLAFCWSRSRCWCSSVSGLRLPSRGFLSVLAVIGAALRVFGLLVMLAPLVGLGFVSAAECVWVLRGFGGFGGFGGSGLGLLSLLALLALVRGLDGRVGLGVGLCVASV